MISKSEIKALAEADEQEVVAEVQVSPTDAISSHQIAFCKVWRSNEHIRLFVVYFEHFLIKLLKGLFTELLVEATAVGECC